MKRNQKQIIAGVLISFALAAFIYLLFSMNGVFDVASVIEGQSFSFDSSDKKSHRSKIRKANTALLLLAVLSAGYGGYLWGSCRIETRGYLFRKKT